MGIQICGEAFNTYALINHPLLLKYNFDPIEFMVGAKDVYSVITRVLLSEEYCDFIKGVRVEEPEGVKILRNTHLPLVFRDLDRGLRQYYEKNGKMGEGVKIPELDDARIASLDVG